MSKISLDTENVGIKEVLEQAEQWKTLPAGSLSPDQTAILNLKAVLEMKKALPQGGGAACFICITAA